MNGIMFVVTGDVLVASGNVTQNQSDVFLTALSQAIITSTYMDVWTDGSSTFFNVQTKYEIDRPADVANFLESYDTFDSNFSQDKLIKSDVPYPSTGDMVVALTAVTHDAELQDSTTYFLPSGMLLIVGEVARSASSFYDPFETAQSAVFYSKIGTAKTRANVAATNLKNFAQQVELAAPLQQQNANN